MGWSDALDTMWELQAAYVTPERIAQFDGAHPGYEQAAGISIGAALGLLLTTEVEPVWVDADTCRLVVAAAEPKARLDVADGLAESDLFTPAGFCLFETPLRIPDTDGDSRLDVFALSWAPKMEGGVWFSAWRDWRQAAEPEPEPVTFPHRLVPTAPVPYEWGRAMEAPIERSIMTLFLMARQFASARVREKVVRATRRRGEQRNRAVRDVTVVRLPRKRGASGSDGSDSGYRIEHDHRWWVRPFWRQQWYPKQQRHRQILVPGHARGPADKPLVVKPRAFEVKA